MPIAVLIGLFAFKDYFLEQMSQTISATNNNSGIPEYFKDYDLSQKNTEIKGTLLEFGATNCSACRQMEKVLAELRLTYHTQLNIDFINITTKEGLATGRKFGLVMIPMQVLLDAQGNVVFRHTGYIGTNELSNQIKKKLNLNI